MEIKKYEDDLITKLGIVVNEIITETPKLSIAVREGYLYKLSILLKLITILIYNYSNF